MEIKQKTPKWMLFQCVETWKWSGCL